MDIYEKINSRQEANMNIIEAIKETAEAHPELRFIQLLWALGIINRDGQGNILDKFYEESVDTLSKLQKY